ncbi:MAG: hypothetical protein WC551_06340 [Patescibacteria group bacterium]
MRKDIALNLLAQTVSAVYGVEEYYTTSFTNIEQESTDGMGAYFQPPTNLRLRMTNTPVVDCQNDRHQGDDRNSVPVKLCILNQDELVRIQLNKERRELSGNRRASRLTPDELSYLEYFESLRILEYSASIEVSYGKEDFITSDEALDAPELLCVGPEIERLIKQGLMDVLIADTDRVDSRGERKPAKVNRPHTYTLNLWDLRRIVAKNTVPASIPERLGGYGSRFFLLTGTSNQGFGQSGVCPTHVIVGRMPDEGARPRRSDYRPGGKLGQGKRGQPRRGWILVLKLDDVKQANYTYQQHLVPKAAADGVVYRTMHMTWLQDHPVWEEHPAIVFLKKEIAEADAKEAAAAAAQAEKTEPDKAEGAAEASEAEPVAEPKVAEAEASPAVTQGEATAEPAKAEGAPDAATDKPRETMPVGDDELIPKAEGAAEAPKAEEAEAVPAEAQGEAKAEPEAAPIPAPVVQSQPDVKDFLLS